MQWKHLGLNEARWEMEDGMRDAYPFLFNLKKTEGGVVLRGRGM